MKVIDFWKIQNCWISMKNLNKHINIKMEVLLTKPY